MKRLVCLCLISLFFAVPAPHARADIFQWEYINPANPGLGKQPSTTLCVDGAGVDAVPFANLDDLNLTMAYLIGADLTFAEAFDVDLTDADLSQASLPNANFYRPILSNANFSRANLRNSYFTQANFATANLSNADVRGTIFDSTTGFTATQIYSTASYQAHDLTGIGFLFNDLSGTNFAGQNLTGATFEYTTLTGANFTGAEVRGANFTGGTTTPAQIYSTASYQAHNLTGIGLIDSDLSGWNFAGQNLTNARITGDTLTAAEFTNAIVRGVQLSSAISLAQLYSTASYQMHDLRDIDVTGVDLTGANFVGQNLTNARLSGAKLIGADLRQANLTDVSFEFAILNNANLSQLNLTNGNFYYANLTNADLSQANLTNARFESATMTGADFSGADVRGANFSRSSGSPVWLTLAQLYSTASYKAHDLTGINLDEQFLFDANFAGQNLSHGSFKNAPFHGANLTGADVRWADFTGYSGYMPSLEQLYSTSSYQAHDLTGIGFGSGYLYGANFAGQNLTNANFENAYLNNADITGGDLRGANFLGTNLTAVATLTNAIRTNGHINGLDLTTGLVLVVHDYDGDSRSVSALPPIPITVDQHFAMGPDGTLKMVFEADEWDSTISFAAGIPVALGGTLELAFADGTSLAGQVGRTFDVFDWTGVTPSGAFAVASAYTWNLDNLYTTGEVTLLAIPGLPGDFNQDGSVDAADYVVWRKGAYTQADYQVWRAHFGQTAFSGAAIPSAASLSAAVPEPATLVLLMIAAIGWCLQRRRTG